MLDLATFEYRPAAKPALPALEMAKNAATLPERLRLLLANDPAKDKAAAFLWPFLASLWNYAADRIGEVAGDAASIDRAMRAGFNWEMGPFEMWDAAGVGSTVDRMKALGLPVSPRVEALLGRRGDLAAGQPTSVAAATWYARDGRECFQPEKGKLEPVATVPGHARVADFRRSNGVVRSNAGASLVDLGDGIGCIELHSLKNAIGGDVLALVSAVLKPDSDAVRDFAGFVITGDRDNFSRGRQPDATAAGGAGGRVGGAGRRHPRLPADDRGHQVLPAAGGGGALWHDLGRRRGDLPARRAPAGSCGDLYRPGRSRSGPDSSRRRHQGDAAQGRGSGRRAGAARPARPAFALCPVGRVGHGAAAGRSRRSPWPRSPPRPPRRGRWGCSRLPTASP